MMATTIFSTVAAFIGFVGGLLGIAAYIESKNTTRLFTESLGEQSKKVMEVKASAEEAIEELLHTSNSDISKKLG